jgi:hypothetical protein
MTAKSIESWQALQLKDLFFAYRKAKADCYFERSICIAQQFATYETEVPARLGALLARLTAGEVGDVLAANLGIPRFVSKKLGIEPKQKGKGAPPDGHGFFSDPSRAFKRLCDTHLLTPEFRLIGDFPVDMHVLSALWINLVGHKFDGVLANSSYGSRLRRYRPEPGSPQGSIGSYHTEAIGSFQPYFDPYKRWRKDGLEAIRTELQADRAVVAISMDLTSYYHRVDPAFMADRRFLNEAGIELTCWELEFTAAFAAALESWSKLVATKLVELGCSSADSKVGGLPIGLSISRVAANALLVGLDRDIEQGLAPVFYGRYVDDLFLVMRDPGNITEASQLLKFISARTRCFPPAARGHGKDEIYLTLPGGFQGRTTLLLQQKKQKAFFLQGQGGLDLLDNIETQIRSVSSERRLMPSPDRLESMASAKVLTAAGHPSEEADTLRRADGLAVRRLGWSIQLRAVETLARDLREDDWKEERAKFYLFAHSHILRPDKILDHLDYLPRLLSIAVALMDWPEARRLIDATFSALLALQVQTDSQPVKVNGCKAPDLRPTIWEGLRTTTLQLSADAVSRALRWSQRDGGMRPLSEAAIAVCAQVGLGSSFEEIRARSVALRESDWAKTSYKDHLRRDAVRHRPAVYDESKLHGLYDHEDDLLEFLRLSADSGTGTGSARVNRRCFDRLEEIQAASSLPYLFPTRAYSTQEVSLFLPDRCVFDGLNLNPAREWARYVRAVRGVWVWGSLVSDDLPSPEVASEPLLNTARTARLGSGRINPSVRLGISSLLTKEESFSAAASGRPDISRGRYERVERLINQAISAHPRPTHLLLPELSLPERWIDTVSGLLRDAGISLIAGLDYHRERPNWIHSEAVLVLTDDRLGFPASVQIRQPKSLPAAGEEETLLKTFGQSWPPDFAALQKPAYIHEGFCFGVLVCSELQNVKHRQRFQGEVDCMMVLSWNQDLETFSALVESASLDVHAHIALVNNRKYGDSRVRTPAKEHHGRDLCRLRGGQNEHVVVVELDINGLRAFQSRATRWPSKSDPYKPVPEGYRIATFRRRTPT